MLYLWVKAFHIVSIVCWFAGLFYLPRLFVNHAMVEDAATRERLALMEMKLYRFMTPLGVLAVVTGLWLWLGYGFAGGWLHAKLALVALMLAHYLIGGRWLKAADAGKPLPSSKALRWFNEAPVFLLIAIVWLVLAKPF